MVAHLRQRRSRLASWSWRLAVLSLLVLGAGAVGHRFGTIETDSFFLVLIAGFSGALLALLAAAAAFEGIWRDGRSGVRPAVAGTALGLALLAVPAWSAWRVVTLPRLGDISTDWDNPPRFTATRADRSQPSAEEVALAQEAYPEVVAHTYPVPAAQAHEQVLKLAAEWRWEVIAQSPPAARQPGTIQAVALSPLFAFRDDIAIRITATADGTRIDMRTAIRHGTHDFGRGAARIRDFLTELDGLVGGSATPSG